MNKDKRYQNQPWYIKLWRRRFYLLIPYRTATIYWYNRKEEDKISFKNCYSIAIGLAQVNMNWVYDWEEIKDERK
jgi:hypothetical protein